MTINNEIARAVRYSIIMGAVTAAGTATSALGADAANVGNLEEVVITGSRIAQPNLTNTSPIATITSEDIKATGLTRIEDLVTQLPQAFAAQNATVSNGSNGTATVDLRGLGSQRTLVLIDGRRMPYGSASSSAADLNSIPTEMVERVEVLTGGASAVYGSDAVSGVVNFIMKKDFEGLQIDAQLGSYQHNNNYSGPGTVKLRDTIAGLAASNPSQFKLPDSSVWDGRSQQINLMVGVNSPDGKGNLTAYAGVRTNNAILQADRDYSACTLSTTPPTSKFRCGGSNTSYPGYFYAFDSAGNPAYYTIDSTTGSTFRAFNPATDRYNFGPLNYYQRPDTTYNLGVMGHYDLNAHANVYTQLMFTDYESVAQIAPSGDFFNSSQINCDNPMLSPSQVTDVGCTPADVAAGNFRTLYVARRNVEGGGRQDSFHNNTFRGLVGLRGDVGMGWTYDVSMQFSRVSANRSTLNYFVKDRIARALDVVDVNGVPTCQSVVDGTDPACVPWNIFTLNRVTPAALNYLQGTGLQLGVIDQRVFQGNVSGDLGAIGLKSPWAGSPIAVSLGFEVRSDSLTNTVDALQTAGLLAGSGGPTIGISGQTRASDYYTEVRVPIAENTAFAHDLSFDTAYRYSDYGSNLTTSTYKFGLEWAPIADVRIRGSFQRAVRAPNIVELFTAQGFNLFDMAGDPCGSNAPNPNATAAKCIATGVPAANVGSHSLDSPAGQYNFNQGGNPNLQAEKSDTKSFGIVLQPRFAPGLSFTADYFNIKIDGTVSTYGSENTLNACYNNNDAAACARIHRDASGSLWRSTGFVSDLNINIGSLKTSGIDFTLDYSSLSLGRMGKLSFAFTGTQQKDNITDPGPGLAAYDCKGFFSSSCGTPYPGWRHHARIGWKTPVKGLDASLTWRYISSVEQFNNTINRIDKTLAAQSYFDLAGSWAVAEKATVRMGINNILDRDPPLNATTGTTGNGNTYPQAYDAFGRYLYASVTWKY